MKRALFATALTLLAAVTVTLGAGTTANLSWTPPTQYTDGSPIGSSDLAYYTISWTPASGVGGPSGSMKVTAPATAATVPVPCGSVNFTLTVTTGSAALYANATSAPA